MKLLSLMLCLFSVSSYSASITVSWLDQPTTPVVFEQAEIAKLPTIAYKTHLPWFDDEATFTGISLQTLLKSQNITVPEFMIVRALNDYAITITKQDIEKYQPIIAYLKDGKPMKVREKGPYWLIYSLSDYPEIDNALYHSQMVWQISDIELIADEK
ncbi:oxidoreductase [Vibrio makurazakiensis]|uniref:oxidoreductase n=1 Tax=Vibrio makurazakiensis TaxID=2910250 RepID=UPI003D0C6410